MAETIKCLLVDDEPLAIQALATLLDKIDTIEVVSTCSNSFEAFSYLKDHQIDLMFLDINMPEMSGLEFLRSLADPPAVIMTTAHREFAVEAFDLEVIDYLLKPISAERLMKSVSRYLSLFKQNENRDSDYNQEKKESDSYLFVRADRKLKKIEFDDILYMESLKDYIKIFTNDEMVMTRMTMQEMDEKLPDRMFLRVHRSYIINKEKITAITNYDIEIGTAEIPIGDSYRRNIEKNLGLMSK